MIKINSEIYDLDLFTMNWGKFTRTINSVTKTGIAPRIYFYVGDEEDPKEIILELTYTKEEFENMEKDIELDIKGEIVDIIYNDKEGWISLGNTNYVCSLTKVEEKKFHINFKCSDAFENIAIEIDELITL